MFFSLRKVLLFCLGIAVIVLITGFPSLPSRSAKLSVSAGYMEIERSDHFDMRSREIGVLVQESNTTNKKLRNTTQTNKLMLSKTAENDSTDVANIDKMYFINKEDIENRVLERMDHIKKTLLEVNCKMDLNQIISQIPLYQMNEVNISWCPVFKSGSTTWKTYFINKLVPNHSSYNLKELDRRKLKIRYNDRTRTRLFSENEGNARFTVVRHPLSRLISHAHNAAKDREMVAMEKEWISKAILVNRLKLLKPKDNRKKKQYEEEFKNYFLWLRSRRKGPIKITEGNVFLEPPYPLLDDLVSHIIRTKSHNGHWTPAWRWCRLCKVDYHYIIKLEEQPLELWYLLDKLGLWEDRTQFLTKTNNSQNPAQLSEQELFEKELRMLDNEQREWVNKYFENDFKLFGYEKLKLDYNDNVLDKGVNIF